jgi:hypothetical protein
LLRLQSLHWCPRSPCTCSCVSCARRWRRPRSPCKCSFLGYARRWTFPHSPCTCSFVGCARRWRRPRSPCKCSSVGSRLRLLPPRLPLPPPPAPSALAPLLAMPTLALFRASAPTTAPSFSVGFLPLIRVALALVLNGLAFLGGLDSLGGRRARRDAEPWRSVERKRHGSRGRHRKALCPAHPERAAADAGAQTMADHAVVALYPHSTDQRSCIGAAAEMGQATRRKLALGLRSAEASLAATRGREEQVGAPP